MVSILTKQQKLALKLLSETDTLKLKGEIISE
jgi:hypothetical protein